MPCYDSRTSGVNHRLESCEKDLAAVENQNEWMRAALCAMFSELERRDICASVVAEASRSGLVGLMEFWDKHQDSDKSRMAKVLHGFSKDEQQLIREILK